MQVRTTLHEVRAGLANLRAIHHEPNVVGFSMFAALLQAIGDRLQTGFVTILAKFDTSLKMIVEQMAF
jgi:hypothetical protein